VIPPDIKNDERDLLYQPLSRPPGERPAPMNLGLPPFTLLTIVINTCIVAITIAFLLENLNAHPTNIFKKRYSPEMFAWLHLTTAKSRPRSSGSATWSCVYALILFISLTAFQLIVNTLNRRLPKLPHGMYDLYWPQVVARVIAFVTLAACLLAILCILSRAFQGEKPNNRVLSYFLTILLTLTSLVASAILTFAPWFGGSQLLTAIQFERWGSVVEGVTPLVPLACMAFIPVVWAACQLRRGYFDRIHGLVQPYSEQETPGLAKRLQDLDAAVTKPYWIPVEFRDWILLACIVWFGGSLYFRWIRTADAPYFDAFFWTFGLIDVALIYTLHVRFMAASGLLERLLRRIAQTQLADSFKQVPPRLKSKAAGQIFAASPHPGDLNIVTRQLEDLVHRIPFKDVKLQRQSRVALRRFKKMDTCARLNKAFVNACLYPINDSLSKSCRRIIKHVVHRHYAAENAQAPDLSDNNWNIDAANFIATQTTTLIRQAFAQIQNLLIFLTIMLLLLICAVYSYPFQPRHYISFCLIGLVMWTIVSIVVTFIRLNRNEVLSNLSDTTPNHFTPDRALVRQLFVFGLIPLLSLLAFQFPEFGNVFFFWVNGMQNAFK
jgi:hypothetical protein